MASIQDIKNRFGIIGSSASIDRAINVAMQVAPTDLSVLITGESGSGKEVFPQIIHNLSTRKHGQYIAVNCGAIPEGTIDSELFGHEKGSFTGAHEARKGYFEVANGGTIFLDEVGELPLATQARLLRVLESGEFMKVGSSKVQKTDVRIVAATNVNILEAISRGKFREDLYYRLNSVPIIVPPLRERKEDIHLLFRKFAADFATRYRMPHIKLSADAVNLLNNYRWPGNVRQLKNITEQISAIEHEREITADILVRYIPIEPINPMLPALLGAESIKGDYSNERDILYKVLFDMRKEISDLRQMVLNIAQTGGGGSLGDFQQSHAVQIQPLHSETNIDLPHGDMQIHQAQPFYSGNQPSLSHEHAEVIEDSLSLQDKEKEMILRALKKYKGKRKPAAKELGISERTLYRKINEYNIPE